MSRRAHGTGSVYQDPRGRWVASIEAGWTRNGTRRRIRRVTTTQQKAKVLLRELLKDPEPTTTRNTTVKAWAEKWIEQRARDVRPASFVADRSAVRWIVETIGHRRLDLLNPSDVRAVGNAVLDAGRSPATAIRYRSVLDKLLKDARSEGHAIPAAVFDVTAIPKGENDRPPIPLEAASRLILAALAHPDGCRWLVAILHGIRPAECLGLTWDRVDLEAGVASVEWQLKQLPHKIPYDRDSGFRVPTGFTALPLVHSYALVRPKTAKGRRTVALHPVVTEALRQWQQVAQPSPYGLVWPRPNGLPMSDKDDRARWHELCTEAGVEPFDLYSARHTAATTARGAGADDQTITAIMGHSSILSSIPYMHHADLERQRQVSQGVGDRLGLTP